MAINSATKVFLSESRLDLNWKVEILQTDLPVFSEDCI